MLRLQSPPAPRWRRRPRRTILMMSPDVSLCLRISFGSYARRGQNSVELLDAVDDRLLGAQICVDGTKILARHARVVNPRHDGVLALLGLAEWAWLRGLPDLELVDELLLGPVPMPVSASDVMFAGRTMAPLGILNSVPPEYSRPGGVPWSSTGVWHSPQTAALSMYSP